jgi:hypothetical protein
MEEFFNMMNTMRTLLMIGVGIIFGYIALKFVISSKKEP